MLAPEQRHLFYHALRPPDGYRLDFAVGTTYSLDLAALLSVPLAFTRFEAPWDRDEAVANEDALLPSLEAVRRHAGRLAVFHQAGQIAVPPPNTLLLPYLEDSVFPVKLPRNRGIFHPKVWVVRFERRDDKTDVRYRLLCCTRNLTFDTAWDTMLRLEGTLTDRERAYADNHPLGDFLAALPGLSQDVPPHVRSRIGKMEKEVRRVQFELPEGFDSVTFWALGIGDKTPWPFEDAERVAIVAPFLSAGFLAKFADLGKGHVLVSNLDALQEIPGKGLKGFREVYALDPSADLHATTEEQASSATPGLHAKLFILERKQGWYARVLTGSANATEEAFGANVEFLAELRGKKSLCGIEAFLDGPRDEGGFRALLRTFTPPDNAVTRDTEEERIAALLEAGRRAVIAAGPVAKVEPSHDAFHVDLRTQGAWSAPEEVEVTCWPVTLAPGRAVPFRTGTTSTRFENLPLEVLTAFFAFQVSVGTPKHGRNERFVVRVPIEGMPEGRLEQVLHKLLADPDKLLRFLYLLLAEPTASEDGHGDLARLFQGAFGAGGMERRLPLLEALLRALDRNPEAIEQVARVVEDLRRAPGGAALPEGFDRIWEPVLAAHRGRSK